ncbi:MAG: hypothetical protein IKJ27_02820 [Clostridia bacterium]|nr:hypothetical protein [Clostridia bacterium]
MKKLSVALIVVLSALVLFSCGKNENKADTSVRKGETEITGTVEQVSGNSIIIHDGKGSRYSFTYSDGIDVVENGWYVVDLAAASFAEKEITVICSDRIMETYPAMLSEVRVIVIKK